MPHELEGEIVESLVGEDGGNAWTEWAAKADLPKPEKMLKEGWTYNRLRLDISLAAITNMTKYVIDMPYKEAVKTAAPAWGILHHVVKDGNADITMESTQLLIRNRLGRKHHGNADLAKAAEIVITALDAGGYSRADLRDD